MAEELLFIRGQAPKSVFTPPPKNTWKGPEEGGGRYGRGPESQSIGFRKIEFERLKSSRVRGHKSVREWPDGNALAETDSSARTNNKQPQLLADLRDEPFACAIGLHQKHFSTC